MWYFKRNISKSCDGEEYSKHPSREKKPAAGSFFKAMFIGKPPRSCLTEKE